MNTVAIAAQVSMLAVAASPYVGRRLRRAIAPRIAEWRDNRTWARDLKRLHDDHYTAAEPVVQMLREELSWARASGRLPLTELAV